ncbi:MAG: hypothetical protein H6541_02165 [Lentimicrobiaceae bacterium]|nr:hypothetical protein [Lentimicrobiaceae bacterium]MCB9023454.1 hypothetical protein [Lentimicrobiaceae bacterium]MCO5265360.1 hypothetical protein [Lentimicrobium sp.]HPG34397.1 hypothetical protein [Lentimicrobium sp.]
MFLQFEGIRIVCINAFLFRRGAAVTIPGVGIITGKSGACDINLLRHEFGHILQFRQQGACFYWCYIAPASLLSAIKAHRHYAYRHMSCWTEWSANLLSYRYFNEPESWDHLNFPVRNSYVLSGKQSFRVNAFINSIT